jgi:hypothetical protein
MNLITRGCLPVLHYMHCQNESISADAFCSVILIFGVRLVTSLIRSRLSFLLRNEHNSELRHIIYGDSSADGSS